jgi:hypothetical protein
MSAAITLRDSECSQAVTVLVLRPSCFRGDRIERAETGAAVASNGFSTLWI